MAYLLPELKRYPLLCRPVRTGLILLALLGWSCGIAAQWQEYEARYAVYRNGKVAGRADLTLRQHEGDRWSMKSDGSGTHGLARILRASDVEEVKGRLEDGRFLPEQFFHHTRVAGIDDIWEAKFDWSNRSVAVTQGDENRLLEMTEDALDPLSLKLEMRRSLRAGEQDMSFHLVDEDEIKEQQFRVLEPEYLETSLGCLRTVPVERVRPGSSRYTRIWHAPQLEYLMVRMEHGKIGGNHVEMRITGAVLGDSEVAPEPGCAARQGDFGTSPE